jgi:predicted amidohydrolase YtcJ
MGHRLVSNCYDSHVHWLATGQVATSWRLHHLKSALDISRETLKPSYFRGEWLVGFGWDNNLWPGGEFPHRSALDKLFPNFPVALSRADGHAVWVNSVALQRLGMLGAKGREKGYIPPVVGGRIVLDDSGSPTGILIDLAKSLVDALIPHINRQQVKSFLLKGMQEFNRAGITHIRDMSCSEEQWTEVVHLAEAELLTMAVEQTFSAENPNDFEAALDLAIRARRQNLALVRAQSIKIYCDGALGSEGALLSCDYQSGSGRGLELLSKSDLQGFMHLAWESGFDLAVHTIGDEAAHRVILAAQGVWEKGIKGKLHLEHAQMLRPETIFQMPVDSVTCHLQPCHWLSDRKWLRKKLGSLYPHAFPWRALQEAGIPFFFGSDSPIEKPSIQNTLLALEESPHEGIPKLFGDPLLYHSHPDGTWVPSCFSQFTNGIPTSVVFKGVHLI